MNKNLDLRIQKTYSCLMNAMLELLKEKNFEELTVNELCERALVGRGTFYNHFADKYEFFSFFINEKLENYITEAEEKMDQDNPCSYYEAFFETFIRFVEKSNESLTSAYKSSVVSLMLLSTSDILSQKLEKHFRLDAENGRAPCVSPSSAARFLTGAMGQSARYLLAHPDEARKEEIISNMKILIEKMYE